MAVYTDAPESIDWPLMVDPPPTEFEARNLDGTLSKHSMVVHDRRRTDERKKGHSVWNWERPPQKNPKDGVRLLATGQVIDEHYAQSVEEAT